MLRHHSVFFSVNLPLKEGPSTAFVKYVEGERSLQECQWHHSLVCTYCYAVVVLNVASERGNKQDPGHRNVYNLFFQNRLPVTGSEKCTS